MATSTRTKAIAPHDDSLYGDSGERCPCDECVAEIEAKRFADIWAVWPHRLPYAIKNAEPPKRGSGVTLPSCTLCGGRFIPDYGKYAEVSFYVNVPITERDEIPFPHVKRVLIHHTCAETLLEQGIGKDQSEDLTRDIRSQHHRLLIRLMAMEPTFIRRLARAVNFRR